MNAHHESTKMTVARVVIALSGFAILAGMSVADPAGGWAAGSTGAGLLAIMLAFSLAIDACLRWLSGVRGWPLATGTASMASVWFISFAVALAHNLSYMVPGGGWLTPATALLAITLAVVFAAAVLPSPAAITTWLVVAGVFGLFGGVGTGLFVFEDELWYRITFTAITLLAMGMLGLYVRRALRKPGALARRIGTVFVLTAIVVAYSVALAALPTTFLAITTAIAGGLQGEGIAQSVAESVSMVFPWIYLGVLLPLSAALLAFERRDAVLARAAAGSERARLNRDAHDRVYNRLTALANRMLAEGRPANEPAEVRATVAELQHILGDAPASASEQGVPLGSLLEDLRDDAPRRWNVEVTLEGEGLATITDPRVGWELLCIAEEAIANSSVHGAASTVTVRIDVDASGVVLLIADDGSGVGTRFDSTQLPATSTGIRGMITRTAALGGTLTVESGAAGGTFVTARVPL
ncbi:MAG: hypothetical protein Q8S43_01045 [Actinomycetota bacterium]|nr:MAG: integral membrane sensor signal transduction histidine [Actinomycetota bacterium]MDO8950616.1 hypothetical protein [Actinomycetota bacterium]MDP3629526.1 hypothetical protein [Actinomycetota bacterium]